MTKTSTLSPRKNTEQVAKYADMFSAMGTEAKGVAFAKAETGGS